MIYNRSHLFKEVDVASPPKVTLIIAESGFGKTILARQYVDILKLPYIWNPLNPWSAYAHTLYKETENLLAHIYPSIASLTDNQEEPCHDAGRLANRLKTFGAPIVYVIDNCHYINQHHDGLAWLEDFIRTSDQFCHFVLVGQEQPKIDLVDFIATDDCLILGKNQLCLTNDDVDSLSAQSGVDRYILQTQIEIHQGWFAGMKPVLDQTADKLSELTFQEYVTSLIDRFSEDTRHLFYISNMPEMFEIHQLEAMFPQDNIRQHLREIIETPLAPIQLPNSNYYQYHDLIRNPVLIHLQKQDNNLYRYINHQFGAWYEKEESFDLAIYHYLEARQPDAASRIMNYIFHVYERHGYTDALLALEKQFRKYDICIPLLQLGAAAIKIANLKFDEALESLDYIAQSETAPLDLYTEVNIKNRKAYIALRQGRIEEAIHILGQIQNEYQLETIELVPIAASTIKLLGQAFLEDNRYQQAEAALLEAKQLYEQVNSHLETAAILQDLALVYTKIGQLTQAGEALQQMLSIRKQLNQPSGLAHAHNNIGSYYIQCHDYVNGEHHFIQGLEASQTANDERITAFLHWNLGDFHRDVGSPTVALSHYEQALAIVNTTDPFIVCGVLASLARLWICQHRRTAAVQSLKVLKTTAQRIHSELYTVIANISLLALESPCQKQHVSRIEDLLEELQSFGNPIEVIRVIGLLLDYAISNDENTLIDKLTRVLKSYIASNYSTQPFVAATLHSKVLWQYLLQHQLIFPELLHQVGAIRTWQAERQQQLQEQVDSDIHTVYLTTFHTESMNFNDVHLTYKQLPGHQERDFIYWVYFTGPKTRPRIILRYWSDSPPNKGQSALTSMLYRIRQKLGPIMVTENELYHINPQYNVTSDAHLFEKLHQQAKIGRINDVRTEDLWLQALRLYRGEFLSAFDGDWLISLREKYHQYYIDTLVSLSQCALIRQDETAIAYANWAIREDPYNEAPYQHLMRVFSAFHRVDEIFDTYSTLSRLLDTDLNVDVSVETQELFNALTQHR